MNEKKEFEVIIHPDVQEQMDNDPELAEAMRDFAATVRQAKHGVETGQYKSFDDAMEALTGNRPEKLDVDWDEDDD